MGRRVLRAVVCLAGTSGVLAGCGRPSPKAVPHTATPTTVPAPLAPGASASWFDPAHLDLGEHVWFDRVPFAVSFVNRAEAPVVVHGVKRSCGCTVISEDLEGSTLAAGEAVAISGEFRTGYLLGHSEKTISVVLDSGEESVLPVTITVRPTYEVRPDAIDVKLSRADADDGQAQLTFQSKVASITSVAGDSGWLRAVAGANVITVRIDADLLPYGVSRGTVVVNTDDQYLPSLAVPVRVFKAYGLDLQPSYLVLTDGTGTSRQVRVALPFTGEPVEVASAAVVDGGGGLALDSSDRGFLRVSRVPGAGRTGSWTVMVRSSDGTSAVLRVATFAED